MLVLPPAADAVSSLVKCSCITRATLVGMQCSAMLHCAWLSIVKRGYSTAKGRCHEYGPDNTRLPADCSSHDLAQTGLQPLQLSFWELHTPVTPSVRLPAWSSSAGVLRSRASHVYGPWYQTHTC